jgi:hypothetical protein
VPIARRERPIALILLLDMDQNRRPLGTLDQRPEDSMKKNRLRWGAAVLFLALGASVGLRLLAQPVTSSVTPRLPANACSAAAESIKPLAEIRNTRDPNFDCLGLAVGHGSIRALHIEAHRFSTEGGRDQVEQVKTIEFAPADIERDAGVVLDGIPGHDAIILRGKFSANHRYAELETSFLYNGLTGEYHRCAVKIDGSGESNWRLVDAANKPIEQIVIRTWQLPLLGIVGIETLDGVCPN